MAPTTTYTLRNGAVVTSRDGKWPLQYVNRTQAERAAAKIGGTVLQRGRPFYVVPPPPATSPALA